MSWDLAELMREAGWSSGHPEELTMCQQKLTEPLSRDEAVQRLKDLRSGNFYGLATFNRETRRMEPLTRRA